MLPAISISCNVRMIGQKPGIKINHPRVFQSIHDKLTKTTQNRKTKPISALVPTAPWWARFSSQVCCMCVLRCVFFTLTRYFYFNPSTSSTTSVRADSSILERHKLCGHKTKKENRNTKEKYEKKVSCLPRSRGCGRNSFGTAVVSCWGQTTWNLNSLSPKRDVSTKKIY